MTKSNLRTKTSSKSLERNSKITDPVQVFCRIRPLFDESSQECVEILDESTIRITSTENSNAMRNGGPIKETNYTFASILDKCSQQEDVFKLVGLPLVDDLLTGKNGLLFTYGVTSSGKTHTMTGSNSDQGITPRCLEVIFNSINDLQANRCVFKPNKSNRFNINSELEASHERLSRTPIVNYNTSRAMNPDPSVIENLSQDYRYAVFVSFVEIYNNYIYDLLESSSFDKQPISKNLREDSRRNVYVSGATEVEVVCAAEALAIIAKGQKKRKVAHTNLNADSSRSHSVFNIRIVQAPYDDENCELIKERRHIIVSQLSLVDLAGSERTMRTGNHGERLREAGNINQSLMVLRNCLDILRDNQLNSSSRLVPYRDSKITHVFKNYFEGDGKVRMIVCVNPDAREYDETLQVMRFAEATQEVQITRANQIIKTDHNAARKNARKLQMSQEASDMVTFSWPPGPSNTPIEHENTEDIMNTLIEYLSERGQRRDFLLQEQDKSEHQFRDRIIDMEKDFERVQQRNKELESLLKNSSTENNRASKRIKELEKAFSILQKTSSMYEHDKIDLEKQLDERDFKISCEQSEKNRMRQDYQAKLTLKTQAFNRQIETTRKKAQEENSEHIRKNQRKFDKLANIINSDTASISSSNSIGSRFATPQRSQQPTVAPRTARIDSKNRFTETDSRGTAYGGGKPSVIANQLRRVGQTVPLRGSEKMVSRVNRARSPPPLKPKPMANPKNHRRSKSVELWLEHTPRGTLATGMILQPQMNKKRSVTNLKSKHVKTASKYVLTHQGVDSEGDVVTQLIKGAVCPTVGGGRSVVYNDVEMCKQTDPVDKSKRKRSPGLKPSDYDGEWTDTETRCKIAIEGHNISKRARPAAVV